VVSSLLGRFLGADVAIGKAQDQIKQTLGLAQSDELGPLLRNDLVAARTRNGALAAWVVKDEADLRAILAGQVARGRLTKRAAAGGYERYARPGWEVAVKGPLIVVGEPAALTAALQTEQRHAGMSRSLFDERLRGLPADSLLRFEANAALIPPVHGSSIAWLKALGRVAITVRADDSGFHARLRAASAPVDPADVPIAPGATPPAPLGRTNGLTVGIRDLGHIVRALRLNVPKPVIDQLGGTATVWSPDLKTFTVTIPVADPQLVVRALRGVNLARAHLPGARIGAAGRTVVVTTDPAAPLARLAAGSPQRIGNLSGALTGVIRGQSLGQALIDRFGLPPIAAIALGALGDTTFAVRTTTTGVEASADLSIRK
jgi:hypothetical protein